jgi:SAM-dependent methyltransferase
MPQEVPLAHITLDDFTLSILADPITKEPASPEDFCQLNGILDARVFLRNTDGFMEWAQGQEVYEAEEAAGEGYKDMVRSYLDEIEYDRSIYEHYRLDGAVLDVGGGVGTVREFVSQSVQFISIDPYINAPHEIPSAKRKAYSCLSHPLNFVAAMGEFLPFVGEAFDWVHMRSVVDHVQVPDLAMLEARRVLKPDGRVLVGLYVEGGKTGHVPMNRQLKKFVKRWLHLLGIDRWKDHHVWHPTYSDLLKLIQDNGFVVEDVYWQPYWHEQVCYVCARKAKE